MNVAEKKRAIAVLRSAQTVTYYPADALVLQRLADWLQEQCEAGGSPASGALAEREKLMREREHFLDSRERLLSEAAQRIDAREARLNREHADKVNKEGAPSE